MNYFLDPYFLKINTRIGMRKEAGWIRFEKSRVLFRNGENWLETPANSISGEEEEEIVSDKEDRT